MGALHNTSTATKCATLFKPLTHLVGDFTHGAAFVGLASLDSPAFLAPTIAQTLEINLRDTDDPRDRLLEALRHRYLL